MDNTPVALATLLRTQVKFAKNTSERLSQVSRVDAICWFLSRVSHATAKDVKLFATTFKGRPTIISTWSQKTGTLACREVNDPCCSLLNLAYGGVGVGFEGKPQPCLAGSNYGPVSPLYRPLPRHYAATISGLQRAARVEAILDRLVSR
jgi:hypothetical protein